MLFDVSMYFVKKMTNYKVIALYNVDLMENTVVLKLLSIDQLQILHGASKDLFNAYKNFIDSILFNKWIWRHMRWSW